MIAKIVEILQNRLKQSVVCFKQSFDWTNQTITTNQPTDQSIS